VLGKIPEIFGRDFAIGYFLPSAIFVAVSIKLRSGFGYSIPLFLKSDNILRDTTAFAVLAWIGGILLLAANRSLIMLMEGYGLLEQDNLLKEGERRRFINLQSRIKELKKARKAYKARGEKFPPEQQNSLNELAAKAANEFPDRVEFVLPTRFGNAIRSFEVYSRVMYGLEAIPGWSRLLAVIPKDYRDLIDGAKAQMDFWANLLAVSILALIEYLILCLYTSRVTQLWLSVLFLVCSLISYRMARLAALEWGDWVKSSFDVFLPDLRKKLELDIPADKTERQIWEEFSQAILFRLQKRVPARVQTQADKSSQSQ
jgi:hypothetical protein